MAEKDAVFVGIILGERELDLPRAERRVDLLDAERHIRIERAGQRGGLDGAKIARGHVRQQREHGLRVAGARQEGEPNSFFRRGLRERGLHGASRAAPRHGENRVGFERSQPVRDGEVERVEIRGPLVEPVHAFERQAFLKYPFCARMLRRLEVQPVRAPYCGHGRGGNAPRGRERRDGQLHCARLLLFLYISFLSLLPPGMNSSSSGENMRSTTTSTP
ncbi:MAG: hypothetical protein BWY35_02346 [Firmicutes bacterium ADurb.Bin248]|nr:MAG: hypothetical protein BWY35_02346 [Firmicutes bacterium ADurb.Bin248]